jgi:hypothetical protein
MTRDDMIRMAREAGWEYATDDRGFEPLWRFAALVAAADRERIAALAEQMGIDGYGTLAIAAAIGKGQP